MSSILYLVHLNLQKKKKMRKKKEKEKECQVDLYEGQHCPNPLPHFLQAAQTFLLHVIPTLSCIGASSDAGGSTVHAFNVLLGK